MAKSSGIYNLADSSNICNLAESSDVYNLAKSSGICNLAKSSDICNLAKSSDICDLAESSGVCNFRKSDPFTYSLEHNLCRVLETPTPQLLPKLEWNPICSATYQCSCASQIVAWLIQSMVVAALCSNRE